MSADWLEFGPPPRPRRTPPFRAVLAALVVGAVVAALLVVRLHDRPDADAASDPPAPIPSGAASSSSYTPPHLPPRVSEEPGSFVDASLALPVARGNVLFALSTTSVFRIDLATGGVRRIGGAGVTDSGLVSLIAGPEQVLVSIGDAGFGSGTVIPDGRPGRPLPNPLQQRSELYPGPPGLLWAQSRTEDGPGTITLVDFAGRVQQAPILLGGGWPQPDGRGNLLVSDVSGVYETDGNRLHRVTTGVVAGVGRGHYLLVECDSKRRCTRVLLDRCSGARHRLGRVDTASIATGILSPDGRRAALVEWRGAEQPRLMVEDLRRHSVRHIPGAVSQQYGPMSTSNLAWTPDSRWLVMLLDGRITVLDTRTGRTHRASARLPQLIVLTLRPSKAPR